MEALFPHYRSVYINFIRAITQTKLISILAEHSFTEFPARLPTALKQHTKQTLNKVAQKIYQEVKGDKEKACEIAVDHVLLETIEREYPEASEFSKDVLEMIKIFGVAMAFANKEVTDELVEEMTKEEFGDRLRLLVRHQAMVMMLAHFEAFMADTLRVMCRARPDILRMERKVTWADVLQFETMVDFIEYITEKYLNDLFFEKNIAEQIGTLANMCRADISDEEKRFLYRYEARRNLIVHNGGVVSERYIKETRDTSVTVGQVVQVSSDDIRTLFDKLRKIGTSLFLSVAEEFLGAGKEAAKLVAVYGSQRLAYLAS